MTTEDMIALERQIRGLWPTFFRAPDGTRGRDPSLWSAAMLEKLRAYSLREVSAGLQECLTSGKGLLSEADLVRFVRERRKVRAYDPSAWTVIDEHEVQFSLVRHREWASKGVYDKRGIQIPLEREAESRAIRAIGKNPSQQERMEAVRLLNMHITAANKRMEDRGSDTRMRLYPEPMLPLERQNGDHDGTQEG